MTLTPAELESMRDENLSFFTDLCTIYRKPGPTDDAFGGISDDVEAVFAADVPCMLESGAAQEQTRALIGKIAGVQLFTVTLPALQDVRVHDHIIVTTQADMHLRVQAVMAPESFELERRVIGSELGEHNE